MGQSPIDERVQKLVDSLLHANAVEEAFCGFIVQSKANDVMRKQSCADMVAKFWQDIPQESHETALRLYVHSAHSQSNSKRAALLLDMLEEMVANNIVSARLICESLVSSELLTVDSGQRWQLTFRLIRRIVGGVDYKGCRDLLRGVLEKAQLLPSTGSVAVLGMIQAIYEVVTYIMDRNACLLPSYFAVNEITKLFSDDKPWAHWKLGELLSGFVQSFRPAAQMVSISGRSHLLPVVCHSNAGSMWKLNPSSLRFPLNGPLPYDKELYEPQIGLLRYVLEQPYSRDMVCSILSLNKQVKQRCNVLEEQLVDLVVLAMQRSETGSETDNEDGGSNQLLWQHLSSQVIFFVLFQFASFPHMVMSLYDKLKGQNLTKGRDHLMWVLLQFISGSIQKNALEDFLPVMKLYDLLYPEKEPLPMPDVSRASCTHKMAVTCIWIHLNKKAQSDCVKLQRPIPNALKSHLEFLKQCLGVKSIPMTDYKIALLCNAYSTNPEYFALPMGILVESIYGNSQKTLQLPGNITAHAPTAPLRMDMLDSLTVHAKMSLIHSIGTRVIRLASQKSTVALAPALVETYSRLLVYMEIESLGIKGFISQLLPSVFKSNAWGILHTLLEMFSYRLHHIQPHYRVQLLSHLHSLASVPQTNHNQLHLCVESTALRLIMGLGSQEVHPQLSRVYNEQNKTVLISTESEELNRALVLTLARAMHVTGSETISGSWCKEILQSIMAQTPHAWSSHTLACFPPFLAEFFAQNPVPKEDKTAQRRNIENEYRRWKSMASEVELINHFSNTSNQPLFLCVLWRSQLEDKRIAPTAYKVLERIGPRNLSAHLRTFVDYLVAEFSSNNADGQHLNQCVESLSDIIWKCNVVTIDRVILALALHYLEGNDAHVSSFIIQFLLLKSQEFRTRIVEFTSNNSPEHWKQCKWHDKHIAFHTKFPEKFFYEGLQDQSTIQAPHPYLPIYFSNVCLRFIPVFDIVIHRFLELSSVTKSLEIILDHLGSIYKFHDRPVTYLYNTLHYYEKKLRDRPTLKRKLVQAIIGSFSDIRSPTWCLTEDYNNYLQITPAQDSAGSGGAGATGGVGAGVDSSSAATWQPDRDYYIRLIARLVNTIAGVSPSPFPTCDWRFNEFPNAAAHALHASCVELMALPVRSSVVGHALLDIVLQGASLIPRDEIMSWMNAIGLVLTSLPDTYWTVLHDTIVDVLRLPSLQSPQEYSQPFQTFNFSCTHSVLGETMPAYLLAQCHAVWQHASIGQLSHLPGFIKERLKPLISTEEQFLFLCHLVGPFLSRFHTERTKCLLEITVDLYEALENTDKNVEHMKYMDPITDFLYHIKYMFVGDGVKKEVESVIKNLRPALKMRLRFISQSKEETTPS